MGIIRAADILLPDAVEMEKWSVIACDQFTSDRDYWAETCRIVGNRPSSLHMILPEAWIGSREAESAADRIAEKMLLYQREGIFRERKNAMIAVERQMQDGKIRRGLLAAVDLEAYDYRPDVPAPIKATERTVEERLIKRLELRKKASLESPHILVFFDDPEHRIDAELESLQEDMQEEYAFELMQGGGWIRGRSLQGTAAADMEKAFERLTGNGNAVLAAGDGNHSLATAKLCWEERKRTLSVQEKETHPARYALVELVNVYDEGVEIEPIHRVLLETDSRGFAGYAAEILRQQSKNGIPRTVIAGSAAGERRIEVKGLSTRELVSAADGLIEDYAQLRGGTEDYIHDAGSARTIGSGKNAAFLLLPEVKREELFSVVRNNMIFPQKSFSIGSARDKRYYLEYRRIR